MAMNTEELIRALSDAANCGNIAREDVFKAFDNEHRFLQSEMFEDFILPIIEGMSKAYEEKRYDDRNVCACRMAHKMFKVMGELQYDANE